MELKGKIALITGATGGIGSAICRCLAKEGADIGICFHSKSDQAALLKEELVGIGCRAIHVQADVANKKDVASVVGAVRKNLGEIDILVNNAGMTFTGAIEDIDEADWDRCLAVNLKSVFLFTQAVIPEMKLRRQGVIVNITSVGAKIGGINAAACYSASKAGVSCLTIQTARELLSYNINVNAVAPGLIITPMLDAFKKEKIDADIKGHVKGPGYPEDIAQAVLFLVSEKKARWITGEILDVNGGAYMD